MISSVNRFRSARVIPLRISVNDFPVAALVVNTNLTVVNPEAIAPLTEMKSNASVVFVYHFLVPTPCVGMHTELTDE